MENLSIESMKYIIMAYPILSVFECDFPVCGSHLGSFESKSIPKKNHNDQWASSW